jgi:hypothetical protein
LTLDFAAEPPTISWEDATVPVVPRGYWTKDRLQEIFPSSAISAAEKNFEEKSPSMLAASYGKEQLDLRILVPNHLTEYQQEKLYQLLQKYQSVFDGDLGTLPGKPVDLELKSPDVRPYHGRTYPVPKIYENLV